MDKFYNLIIFIITYAGLWYILGASQISKPLRVWLFSEGRPLTLAIKLCRFIVELVECPACFGWWTGVLIGLVDQPLALTLITTFTNTNTNTLMLTLISGLLTAGVGFVIGIWSGYFKF